MSTTRPEGEANGCGCTVRTGVALQSDAVQHSLARDAPKLEDLIPIAVVIAAGCEKCAQRMVTRAMSNGASPNHIRKTLAIAALFQKQDCFAEEVGSEVIARMSGPLAMGRKTLEMLSSTKG